MSLPERVARVEARLEEHERRLEGHARVLFGDGQGGLVGDVHEVGLSHAAHLRASDEVIGRITRVLGGEDGGSGLMGSVGLLERSARLRQRWLWVFVAASAGEAAALLTFFLRGGG